MNSQPGDTEKSETGTHVDTRPECSTSSAADEFPSGNAGGLTLERFIDITGEFGHLHELVTIHINRNGGFKGPDEYFRIVQSILDNLEMEIRTRCRPGMSVVSLKLVVQDWIDKEIAALKKG